MGSMDGKVALVTGAASGIGEATALLFAERGASVAVADVEVAGGEATVAMITDGGGSAVFVECDVSDEEQVKAMVATTVATFGRLDYAANNAGIDGPMAPLAEQAAADYDRVLAVNLRGVFLGMKYQLPVMVAQGAGAIVNTASVAGLVGFANLSPYVASKHGVNGLTKAAALEYADAGVRINSLCPGVIRTPMVDGIMAEYPEMIDSILSTTPLGRVGEPSEMAEVVVWLCSDAASFVHGHTMTADGGLAAYGG